MRRINSEEFCKSNMDDLGKLALKKDTLLEDFLDAYEIDSNLKGLTDEIAE